MRRVFFSFSLFPSVFFLFRLYIRDGTGIHHFGMVGFLKDYELCHSPRESTLKQIVKQKGNISFVFDLKIIEQWKCIDERQFFS